MKYIIIFFFLSYIFVQSQNTSFINIIKQRYDEKFQQKCQQYPFVTRYKQLMKNSQGKYTLFIFHEFGTSTGGLGDRFAGIITAMAYSLRFNRTLLIIGDHSFNEYFQPSFGNIKYSSWQDVIMISPSTTTATTTDTQTYSCINPKPGKEKICAFYHDSNAKIVKIYTNRCYLCRWSILPHLQLQDSLREIFGIDSTTNLFDIAGCLFRLALQPTHTLWDDLERFLQSQNNQIDMKSSNNYQIGVHFRCGDSSLSSSPNLIPNPQCIYITEEKWKGTSFADDKTMDSPIDLGTCVQSVLGNVTTMRSVSTTKTKTNHNKPWVYLASDNIMSAKQINETIRWPETLLPHGACHVDMGTNKCISMTLLHWFTLSLSDVIVTQALLQVDTMQSIYHDPDVGTLQNPLELGPISAFSRYAAIYGLSMNQIRYGRGCLQGNITRLSRQTSGNWVCNPRRFF